MSSPEENEGQEIFDWARRCQELFQKLLFTLVGRGGIGTHYRTLRDYSQRFGLWAGFIGVFADGSASLDHRLRFYPEVQDLVLRMLKLLERNLSHGFWFNPANTEEIAEKATLVIGSETSTSLAAVAALDAIQESIGRLRRLAVLIRKSPSSSLTSRIEAFARKADPAKIEEFQKITMLFVTGRLPGIDSGLAIQLVSSICFRRLRLLYQGKHNEKLKGRRIHMAPLQPEAETDSPGKDPAPIQEYLSWPVILQMEIKPTTDLQQPAISETENSGLDFEKFQRYDGGSTDVSDTTTVTSIAQGYSYPPRPRPRKGDQYCACSWCSDEIKVSNLDISGWWRAHFKKDLQPYVCISEDCSEPAVYFTSFSDWRKHMDGIHTTDWARTIYSPKVWYCDVSPHEYLEFKEKEELERHLHNEHSNELSFEQLERRLARNVLPSPREKGICPLCNQDILKIHQFHERLLVEDGSPPPMVLDQKVRSDKGSRVRFEDVEDVSSADEETFNDLVDDFASLNAKERSNLILGKVSKHIAGHLKSLAFLSIRYLSHDAATGEGDSGKAAFGADDADTEVSNRADKATERILDDFPEAVDGGLEFDDIQADRTDIEEGEHFEGAMGGYEEDFAIIPERETENDDSLEEKKLQTQKATAEQRLSNEEKECRELFRLATGRKYERDKDQVGARAEGTCRWFLRHKNFGEWLGWDSGVLLVTADPGCGKSVLAKYLIDEALPRWQTVCYFFFQDQDQNKLYQALRALLHQLFCYQPSLLRHAISEYAKYRRGLIESTSSLWSILENAAQDLVTGPLIIVLDAMDECAESDMESFVQLLNHPSRNKMKFLLTGRSHAHLETAFLEPVNSFICLHISGEKKSNTVLEDVHHLIGYRVEQLAIDRKLSRQIKHHLAERLLSIRNPTYLWVYLVFEFMRAINMEDAPEEAATTIASLPKNTYEVYEQMLSKSYDRLVMRKALSIILAAERPLTLLEMNVAMNIDKQSNSIDDIKLKKVEALESRFRNLFGFFVSIRRGKIGLFHHTARTFLLAESSQPPTAPLEFHWKHSIAKSYAHSILAGLCVVYLNLFNSKATPLPDTNGEASHSIDSYAFLNYSARKWGVHFHEANIDRDDSDIVPLALKICKLDSRAYAVWSENFQSCYNESPLLKAAEDGHEAFARLLLDQGAHLESKDEWGYTPLSMAAYNGHVEVAKLLLSRGADPDLMDQRGNTPLSWAAERGHVAIVQLLLDRGANPELKDKWGDTPLSWAARHGHMVIIQQLVSQGVNLELTDSIGQTPLSIAAENGQIEVVQLLADQGADLDSRDNNGRTPLSWAAEEGHVAIAQLLLDRGANLESRDNNSRTPLSWAAGEGHVAIAQLLLDRGANSKLLTDQGANLESRDNNGRTPLSWAAGERHMAIVQLLIDRGADVNTRDNRGRTPRLLGGPPLETPFATLKGVQNRWTGQNSWDTSHIQKP